ncbi:LacI family DNA-binding transcriptional regulator [Cellulomonas cellasea]|uniref:LacI family DNA-binding transcriptional regulator n=1 Tax=Cellulomonas cellasea TaxID=43670 RepID=UPI0025A328B8|nr:LacI family DNA-binding transcriptional regulator [Cellulomonas cellasea]MDM8084863.1 LacI family DNA-binding transcriptional regulator [Cellulomonas cellasea]
MTRRPTMNDIALDAGVSRATVSLVVRDSDQIPESTKQRVRASMERLGYVYNRVAGTMRGGGSRNLGLLLTNIQNPYLAEVSMAVEAAAQESEYTLLQGYSLGDVERERRLVRSMVENQVAGLIVMGAVESDGSAFDGLGGPRAVPLVTILRPIDSVAADHVGIDDRRAGRLLGAHLAALGARTVAVLGGFEGARMLEARLGGLREGLAGSPARIPTSMVVTDDGHGNYSSETGAHLVAELLERGSCPDAIVTYTDAYALGVHQGLRQHGIEPGADVALASFDNIPTAAQIHPTLTSVDSAPHLLGAEAFRLLTSRIAEPGGVAESVVVEPHLVIRQSTALWAPPTPA